MECIKRIVLTIANWQNHMVRKHIEVGSMDELDKALKVAVNSDIATVIDIPIDPDEDVYPFVAPGTGLKDMIIGA